MIYYRLVPANLLFVYVALLAELLC